MLYCSAMKRTTDKKLSLNTTTIRSLRKDMTDEQLQAVAGGRMARSQNSDSSSVTNSDNC